MTTESNWNPWARLGVHRQSTDDEIQLAFYALAKKSHPDVAKNVKAAKEFAAYNEAYQILKDHKRCSTFIKDMLVWNDECCKCKGTGVAFVGRGFTNRTPKACDVCKGAGVIFNKREQDNAIKLQSTERTGERRNYHQRKAGAN